MIPIGLFDKLFHKAPKEKKFAPTLNGWAPIYTSFGSNIYASDVVQQALKCIVDELKKLNPTHVRYTGSDSVPVRSTIQDILNEPNPLMTTSEFLEKCSWLLLMNYNVFIIPIYRVWRDEKTGEERRYYEALYPIQPTTINFIEDASGKLYVQFIFANGYDTTLPYENVIHWKYNYSVSQYMGGGWNGAPDHSALLSTLDLNEKMLQGIAKAMNASYTINGVVKYNTLIDDEAMQKNLQEFEAKLNGSQNGFLPIDLKADFTPLKRDVQLVDADTLKFIDEKILRNWGIPLDILLGDYSKETYESFYQRTLEPLIISLSQALTKKLFTQREKAFGNRIELYPKELIFLSVQQTLEMLNTLSPTGALYENEKRVALGLRPLPELEGKRYMSLNWIEADKAAQYQTGKKVNIDVVDENKQVSEV